LFPYKALHWAVTSNNHNVLHPLAKAGASLDSVNDKVCFDINLTIKYIFSALETLDFYYSIQHFLAVQQGEVPADIASQKKNKWISVQLEMVARDRGKGKPAFLRAIVKDKVR
jgi:hypothetical protein